METLKALVVGICLIGLVGCAGMNVSVPVNIASDIAFVLALEKYPAIKPAVVKGLQEVKTLLAGQLTYDELMTELLRIFGEKYRYIYLILVNFIDEDKPVSTSWLKLSDAYKAAIVAKLDRFLLLAGSK